MARLKEFMSDTSHRGRIVFVMMTNRPDKIDADLKRPGRLDVKIPFFFPESEGERAAIARAAARKSGLQLGEGADLDVVAQGTAGRRRRSLQHGPVGVRKARHAPGGGGDGPSGRPDRDRPAAIPDGLDTRVKRQGLARPANELARLAGHENLCAARLDPGPAEGGGEVLSGPEAGNDRLQPLAARRTVSPADTDQGHGEDMAVNASINCQRSLSCHDRE
jgi:SpoVK/Ycf46/Vps4 family AAA+-type ATPase